MSKVVDFPVAPKLRFVVRPSVITVYKDKYGKDVKRKHALIYLQNTENNKEVVHPVSDFIFTYWKQKKYNSMAAAAFKIAVFLNWLFFDSEEAIDDLSNLESYHATLFFCYLTQKGDVRKTVKAYENVVLKFYRYLLMQDILRKTTYVDVELLQANLESSVIYNNKVNINKIHDFKPELILPFIEFAYFERNQIALGVYYQIFGGLRGGEVVNIERTNVKNIGAFGEFGQIINLENKYTRDDINTTSGKGEVKKSRKQVIFPYKNLLATLYKNHLEKYKATDGSMALFVNNQGKSMTGDSYDYHFRVLKEKFILKLESSDDIRIKTYAQFLRNTDWATHIGRGLFSNIMAEYTDNPLELAVARGDSSLSSSLTYMADTQRITDKIEKELELLYTGDFLKGGAV